MSVQDSTYKNAGDLTNSPKLLAKLNLSGPLPWMGLRAGYELRYNSQRLSLDGTQVGSHALSNLHLSTEVLAKQLELSLRITNLFDRPYALPGSDNNWQNVIEQDGRAIQIRAVYRF